MNDRDRFTRKIAALRAKTVSAGCTEAEALAAAELAAQLMRDHGLSEDDIVMSEASVREKTSRATWRSELAGTIGACTNTHPVIDAEEELLRFFGLPPGPEIAIYLRDVCFRAVAAEEKHFKASTFYRRRRSNATRRQAAADFRDALVSRLRIRLIELFRPILNSRQRELAKAAAHRRLTDLKVLERPDREARYGEAQAAGWHAGGRVGLNHGVSGQDGPAGLLERKP